MKDLFLDGSESIDTMNEDQNFVWSWNCWTLSTATDPNCERIRIPCVKPNGEAFELPDEEFIQIPEDWLTFGNYFFSLDASKGLRSGRDEVKITIERKSTTWNAWINSPCDYQRGDKLIVEGHCDDGDLNDDDEHLGRYQWHATIPIDSSTSTTLASNKFLVLDSFAFSQFPSYPNSLVLTCNGEICEYTYHPSIQV